MNIEEAIEIVTNVVQTGNLTVERDMALAVIQKVAEKQIPKTPVKTRKEYIRYTSVYSCPCCGRGFSGTGIADYCYHCGQALRWGDENERKTY